MTAIYVHFPFCRHLCTYCDFDKFAGLEALIEPYVDAVCRQIADSPRVAATSLYVGGGTPSLMNEAQAARIVGACAHRFSLDSSAEATIEANPTELPARRAAEFRDAGFNRLSIGAQSTDPAVLRLLGRRHSAEQASEAVANAFHAGFRNVSVDLMYGVPKQDHKSWASTLAAVVDWGVQHLSCYMLTFEEGTPLHRGVARGSIPLPGEDETLRMHETAREQLAAAGYRRYEISNWALPGFEAIHNLEYWKNHEFLGIGAGAAGYWDGRRYKVAPGVRGYIEGVGAGNAPLQEDELVSARQALSDTMILGLRLAEGVSEAGFEARHGLKPDQAFGEALAWAREMDLLGHSEGRCRLTERGILLSNELFQRLL